MPGSDGLVSILIPAYNPRFFRTALVSALRQTYPNLQIIVCDDSSGPEIQAVCEELADPRLTYHRNPVRLGFDGNFTHCFNLADGAYIKFLNDDDVLLPECVSVQVEQFRLWGDEAALVTSRRTVIDAEGRPHPGNAATAPLADRTTFFEGIELGNRILAPVRNFIGEPTTVLFRKADVEMQSTLFVLNGHEYVSFADLSLWLRLMRKGGVIYVTEPLSCYRIHENQLSRSRPASVRSMFEVAELLTDAPSLGFLTDPKLYVHALLTHEAIIRSLQSRPELDPSFQEQFSATRRTLLREVDSVCPEGVPEEIRGFIGKPLPQTPGPS